MNIAVIGLSHKTAPVEIREKLSIPETQIEQAIAQLSCYPHIEEAAILSTCNRLEIYTVVADPEQATQNVIQFLADHSQLPLQYLHQHLFIRSQQDAVNHLMQVASGLDSLVIGEGQILAQVKHTHTLIQRYNGCTKRTLNRLFQQAITVAKRVRTETSIGTGAVSVSSAAVELAQIKTARLSDCRVAIVGAGNMARRLVQHLLAKKVTHISIVNRSAERAEELAKQFTNAQLKWYPLTDMMSVIASADLVFTSTSSTEPLLNRANLECTLTPNQPLMVFDIAVPRNVDADVNELPQVQAFNVDDLKTVVAHNQDSRQQLVTEAQSLINDELAAFHTWWRSRETVPIISCLREKAETIREQELEKTLSRLGIDFTQKHQAAVEALTRCIVNKILHEPMVHLRSQQDIESQRLVAQTLQTVFNLESCVISRHRLNGEQPYASVTPPLAST
ncbi:glutamyl-tRNA reductase [Oculatella sp. LEGE 06141]|uniref:glutamyl-tRNA reductase n=1 Tax=Oculatella sp. LEGE 06141 TaxID=1828648 RepID=UPI001880A230|nr:glutamyl-tRNA reductase [Oculatella sp. LEGE 06141]MBE9181925.1 glutamyl-tRNA reductase [Oculatella sp. LEGE 06141]